MTEKFDTPKVFDLPPLRKQASGSANRKRYGYTEKGGDEKAQRARRSWRRAHNFLAIDGEATAEGKYVLLAASNGQTVENLKGLTTYDCLSFLCRLPVKTLWGFAFDYDVNQILNGLSKTLLTRLSMTTKTYYGEYRIVHLQGKMFRVTDRNNGKTVTVWDAFSFVRTSFARWIEAWGLASDKDLAFIQEMKNNRPDFQGDDFDLIKRYCLTELKFLTSGVDELLRRIEATGYRPVSFHSPGSVAAAVLRDKGIKNHMGEIPEAVQLAAQSAYFGGRFETRITGLVTGPLYHYDINSAYPAAIQNLPCYEHGHWVRVNNPDLSEPGQLVQIEWRAKPPFRDPEKRPAWGPFPVRTSGSLRYPLVSEKPGWYWSEEIEAALPLTRVKVIKGWKYVSECEHRPFEWMSGLYALRQHLKAQGDPVQYVYKLIINSCYGKLAQRPRRSGRIPPFHHPVWAGRITAQCRAQIMGAITQAPKGIIQLATDGLTSFETLDLPISDALGAWSKTDIERLLVLQSGIYFWRDKVGKALQKSRGFHPRTMTYKKCLSAWKRDPTSPLVFDHRRFVGYKTALRRDRMDLWRTWAHHTVHIAMTPEPRRERTHYENGYLLSAPPVRSVDLPLDADWSQAFVTERGWETEQPDGLYAGDGL